MKTRIFRFCIALICLIFILPGLFALVMASETETPEEALERFIKNKKLTLLEQPAEKRTILLFDANEDGWFAIGDRGHIVQVYNQDGVFQYGYSFEAAGSYGMALYGDNVAIYFSRSSMLLVMDSEGNCVRAEERLLTDREHDRFYYQTVKQIGGIKYSVERDIGFFQDYPRLVAVDENSNRKVLYDVTVRGYVSGIFQYLLLAGILAAVPLIIRQKIREEEQAYNTPDKTLVEE